MKYFVYIAMLFLTSDVFGQCAMCRTQVVNNVSAGEESFASGLNQGILYLFSAPYLLIGLIVFLWFRYSKVNVSKRQIKRLSKG